jgi:hypothetical protein
MRNAGAPTSAGTHNTDSDSGRTRNTKPPQLRDLFLPENISRQITSRHVNRRRRIFPDNHAGWNYSYTRDGSFKMDAREK